MRHFDLRKLLIVSALISVPVFGYLIWNTTSTPDTLATLSKTYATPGTQVKEDFQMLPAQEIKEEDQEYTITDTTTDGIDIQFANHETENNQPIAKNTNSLSLSFPKDYKEPVLVKLDDRRTIEITDLGGQSDYTVDTLSGENQALRSETSKLDGTPNEGLFKRLFSLRSQASKSAEETQSYLRYTSRDERKSLLYAYQKDQATGEKKLKHWTLYREGTGLESESYQFKNAKVRVNTEGVAEVFYYGDQELKNDQAVAEVDTNLLERAQRTLAKEMGEDLLNGNHTPDFTIPKPYYIDRNGDQHDAEWKVNAETSTLSVSFTPDQSLYPIALDPTLSFTAPGMSNTGSVITGEASSNFGYAMTSGDFNADGKTDLAVGASGYSSSAGRFYIFYNDGVYNPLVTGADVTLTGDAASQLGSALVAGDFNADGKTDLVVGAYAHTASGNTTGRVYVFYNDGAYPSTVANADAVITGEGQYNSFGSTLAAGDLNNDGKADLVIAANNWNNNGNGKVYFFYNGSITTENASGADYTITGSAELFGTSLAVADFDADGDADLVVGATSYSSYTGRAYVFYNDGSIPTTSATADVIITGESTFDTFGSSLVKGDFNTDGKTDFAVSASIYTNDGGRVYIFYADGTNNFGTATCSGTPAACSASNADVIITSEGTDNVFGSALAVDDLNADGKTDLVIGAYEYSSNTGRVYVFYNDGSIPTTAGTADVIITGETTSNYFGASMTSGDFNSDGKADLAIGAYGYSSNTGRVYIFYSQNGQVNTNQSIVGNASSDEFGKAMVTGDFNADGRTDLAVGASVYSGGIGRVYLFYGDGQIPSTAGTADVTITGTSSGDTFGTTLAAGDFNANGRTDLAVGAPNAASGFGDGQVYLFYNDDSIPTTAGTADITLSASTFSGEAFGSSLTSGDWNQDGKTDLAVGAIGYSTSTGRTYIFYGGSFITENVSGADITLTGGAQQNYFGSSLTAGDFNADGKTDLAVGAYRYSSTTGRVYLFYGGSFTNENVSGADITLTGGANNDSFGWALASGDFNSDGKADLAASAYSYSANDFTGRVYLFYGGSFIDEGVAGADVTLTGEATATRFGWTLSAGDFNADGRTDLAAGASAITTNTGRAYVFYNDGSIPTTAATADVTITGETTSNYFGAAMTAGDMNGDGRTDLIVGAYGNNGSTGKVYFYETRENFAWQIQEQFGNTPRTSLNTSGQELQITGEVAGSNFGAAMATGDWNADGKTDLAVGATTYSTNTGRVYVFYSDGSLATGATNADVILTGSGTYTYFGASLTSGDLNGDGRTDLIVGAFSIYSESVYIFYNDGVYPAGASIADVVITGDASSQFGTALAVADLDADGRSDLVVGAQQHGTYTGRAYVFYADGTNNFGTTTCSGTPATCSAANADAIITGEAGGNYFGYTLTAGDFNVDGKVDVAVGAYEYGPYFGRVYIFYNGSIITENASGADAIITGNASGDRFGSALTSGDFNTDGRTDIAVGANIYGSGTGQAYIFYGGSIATEGASGADVTITGTGGYFGGTLSAGDFNGDGRTDLVVGGEIYSSGGNYFGRIYIFNNDGSYPADASTADVTFTGEIAGSYFGHSFGAGDFNADGQVDLAVGAYGYPSATGVGKVYVYTWNDPVITGDAASDDFGISMTTGDLNADGRTDLVVGATGYDPGGAANTGRAYIFYNDGTIPSTAATADVTITGEASGNYFGRTFAVGDLNADGKTDLVVSAIGYSSSTGRAYIFHNGSITTENASGADVKITGEAASDSFGYSFAVGDFNVDGEVDLAVGGSGYNFGRGRAYIFYNDGSIPTAAATADVHITSAVSAGLADTMTAGDFNSDGKTDLVVAMSGYFGLGQLYFFYADGTNNYGTAACTGSSPTVCLSADADTIITGATAGDALGGNLIAGDFNTDGRTDLVSGSLSYASNVGRVLVFYNDGSYPATSADADVTISGDGSSGAHWFGSGVAGGDFNADGRTDLVIGAYGYPADSYLGHAYVYYNDGSWPTTSATADTILTGVVAPGGFGYTLATGDLNADGKTDIAIGAYKYLSNKGRVYLFTSEVAATSTSPGTSYLKGTGKLKGTMKWK